MQVIYDKIIEHCVLRWSSGGVVPCMNIGKREENIMNLVDLIEQPYLKEGKEKIQIYHSDVFISLPYKKPPTAAAMIMNTGFTCSR